MLPVDTVCHSCQNLALFSAVFALWTTREKFTVTDVQAKKGLCCAEGKSREDAVDLEVLSLVSEDTWSKWGPLIYSPGLV